MEALAGEMNLGSQLKGREGERPSHGCLAAKVTSSLIFRHCHNLRLILLASWTFEHNYIRLDGSFPQSAKVASRAQNLNESD